jgi:uncharacterized OsmC-like protein
MVSRLATACVTSRSVGIRGRAIISAKNHHLVVDSPLSLGGPNEEVNPIDLLLASLASHCEFICERAAVQNRIPLTSLAINVWGEFDPHGAAGEPVDPALRSILIRLALTGPSALEIDTLIDAIKTRCTIYTTLCRAVPITIEVAADKPAAAPK